MENFLYLLIKSNRKEKIFKKGVMKKKLLNKNSKQNLPIAINYNAKVAPSLYTIIV